jgi:hypothetical protein
LIRVAIIGLGPWGACALERLVTIARQGLRPGLEVEVNVIEPSTPGSGVYDVAQPDYLLLNNPCGQLSLYPYAREADQPPYGIGLYDWAVAQGYRWVGDRCAIDSSGQPIEPHHFLPRRLMGEYLQWFYRALVDAAPSSLKVVHQRSPAVDLVARTDGSEELWLADGRVLSVDHAIVTSGHTANEEAGESASHPRQLSPYPVTAFLERLPDNAEVAVAGMGLVALDVVIALTVGRGGRFVERGDGLDYLRSGREPVVHMFSRSGLPFTAKSVTGIDRADVYKPIICTPQALDELSGRTDGQRRMVDVRTELLPLLFAEMYARYYAQVAFQSGSILDARTVRAELRLAWAGGHFESECARLANRYGSFDAPALFFGHQPRYESSGEYENFVYSALADDLREAQVPDGASPVKSAAEVFRIFRDPMRSVVEQGGLSLDSYLDFNADIRSRIHRLVAGPPALRSRQLLALMDAGLVRAPFGPAPALGPAIGVDDPRLARTVISSTSFEQRPYVDSVDLVIRGHLDEPRIDGSASQLLSRLHRRGRVSQFRYGAVTVGSVDLTADSHPIDIDGRPQVRIWMFGVLTEGIRHFTQYIPSPRSRIRAFEEIGACVAQILE